MQPEELFAMVFCFGMFSGVFIVYQGLKQRSLQLEMRHRERMAMIERGIVPTEPSAVRSRGGSQVVASRSLSIGILVVGFGLALMTIISMAAGEPEVGVGVGGAIAILGGAFIVRSFAARPASVPTSDPHHDTEA